MTKIAINQALDAQGFTAHIHNAHSSYIARYVGEKDPGFAVKAAEGRRKPMVQVALERYQRQQARSKAAD